MNGVVITIGNFDGVHRGHQQIIGETIRQARSLGCEAVALTFRPHPQSVLRPDRAPELLLTYDEKREVLLSIGLARVIEQPFDLEFSKTSPSDFFSEVLRSRLKARAVVVGYDFTFGKERTGHLQVLQGLCDAAQVRLTVVAPQRLDQEVISSSVIRQTLKLGQVQEAAKLMGRPFFYQGLVNRGEKRGRKLGFPTANLALGEKLVLPAGVYASCSQVRGQEYASVTHVGTRPTFGSGLELLAETHLLEGFWQADSLYGESLRVDLIDRIRDEIKFETGESLRSQISQDVESARQKIGDYRKSLLL